MVKKLLVKDLIENPELLLRDTATFKKYITHDKVVNAFLKFHDEYYMYVEVEGKKILLVRPQEPDTSKIYHIASADGTVIKSHRPFPYIKLKGAVPCDPETTVKTVKVGE